MNEKARLLERFLDTEKLYRETSIQKQKSSLAQHLNISQSELENLVKSAWNMEYGEWINRKRLDDARAMLVSPEHAGTKIITIAYQCGFSEIKLFNHLFKKRTGMTPTGYRAFHVHFKRVTGVSPEEYGNE